jgi:predicted dithiol-disulfide oxidoreductase (DUF899 family)/uncharacterized protein YndB with AHSA1/START domain
VTTQAVDAFVIEREIRIDAPREQVFALLATQEGMRRWFRPTIFEPRVGGRSEFAFPFDGEVSTSLGEVTAYDPPKRVAFTWTWQSAPAKVTTEVSFDLREDNGGTLVRMTHTGFVDEASVQGHSKGWEYWLGRLQTVGNGGDPGPDNHVAAEERNEQRHALLREEIALKDHIERVAAQRRALGMPDPIDEDYTLTGTDGKPVQFSSLFGDKNDLLVYHLMYKPGDDEACNMCSMWIDGFNGIVRHVRENAAFVVIAKAPIEKLNAWAKRRGWDRVAVYSSYGTNFNRDFHAEDADGDQLPAISAFRRSNAGVHHFYRKSALLDEDNHRGIDQLSPVWNLLDLLPQGRGEWYPSNAAP